MQNPSEPIDTTIFTIDLDSPTKSFRVYSDDPLKEGTYTFSFTLDYTVYPTSAVEAVVNFDVVLYNGCASDTLIID